MKRIVFLLVFTLFYPLLTYGQMPPTAPYLPASHAAGADQAPITVQYPHEKMSVQRGAKNIFLFGKLHLNKAQLTINGQEVPVEKNGTFIAYLPVQAGEFSFLLTALSEGKTVQAVRRIIVPGTQIKAYTQTAEFDPEETSPHSAMELLPGDVVELSVRGTPGADVFCTLSGLKDAKKIPMREESASPGVYRAKYLIDEEQKPRTAKIIYEMEKGPRHSKTKITAEGKIRVLSKKDALGLARVTAPGVKLRKIPTSKENLYPFYRAYGEVLLSGLTNGLYRIALNGQESAWLEKDKLEKLSFAHYHPNHISELENKVLGNKTRLRFSGSKAVPIYVQEFNDRMELTLYYTDGFDENFSFDTTSPIVDKITWSTPEADSVKFIITFKPGAKLWGHAYDFDGNNLLLDLMHQPVISPTRQEPLQGAKILLDAGHSPKRTIPYDGAVGPSGYLEYEANLALVYELKPLLEAAGAQVILTRNADNHMSLQDRYHLALAEEVHLFISLHYNALPETVNPLSKPRGFAVYYNYPHSFNLAKSVYESFTKLVPLADNGMIANDILFIPRIAQMPSILVESAYLILPQQEEMAQSKEGRALFANAIYQGILQFYGVAPQTPAKRRKLRW